MVLSENIYFLLLFTLPAALNILFLIPICGMALRKWDNIYYYLPRKNRNFCKIYDFDYGYFGKVRNTCQ